jgi:5-(carboxyamino)imidazole ribonucleotide mutase
MAKHFVAIIMGSDSDLPLVENTIEVLRSFDIAYEVKVASAHRTPDVVKDYVLDAQNRGCGVFIAAAGLAAHLAGAVAARTVRPVIGIPCDGGPLNGVDALYSTVQMPGGIPVACVAVGKAGAKNAGYLAAQILSIEDSVLQDKLLQQRNASASAILKKNETVADALNKKFGLNS